MARLFAALYVSEIWYAGWKEGGGGLRCKARAMVVFDRIMAGDEHRISLNGTSIEKLL